MVLHQGRWLPRWPLSRWLLVVRCRHGAAHGMTAAAGAWLLVLVVAQMLHALTFAAHHTACMALFEYFPGRLRGRGQALYTVLAYGLPGVVGALAGALGDAAGGSVYWAAMAASVLSLPVCLEGGAQRPQGTELGMIVKNASKAVAALAATLTLTTFGLRPSSGSQTNANFVDIGLIAFNDFHGNLEPPHIAVPISSQQGAWSVCPPVAPPGQRHRAAQGRHPHHAVITAGDMVSAHRPGVGPVPGRAHHRSREPHADRLLCSRQPRI